MKLRLTILGYLFIFSFQPIYGVFEKSLYLTMKKPAKPFHGIKINEFKNTKLRLKSGHSFYIRGKQIDSQFQGSIFLFSR